ISRTGRILGVLSTHWRHAHDPPEQLLRLLDILTRLASDIIDRQQVQQALRDSEDHFRMLADNMLQFAWTADVNGEIYWYNQRWYDYTGTTLEAMKEWGWQKALHPDHLLRVLPSVQRSLQTGDVWEEIFPLRGKDGNYRWFLSRARPIRDEDNKVLRWFGTHTDITGQREMENQIKEQAMQLADESRRKNEFLAMLSHELRNPLAPIRSAVDLLRMHAGNPDNRIQQQAREIIERQVGNLTKLINDLLEVSRVISGRIHLDRQTVDLNQVLLHAVETVKPLIEQHKHTLMLHLGDAPIWINADATRLEEVFINLLNNATKYTGTGGRIEFSCGQGERSDTVQIRVRDNGTGINSELLPRIFQLFSQGEHSLARSAGGLGIGLSLAQRLVDLHGGTIEAHSPPEDQPTGSEFIVNLPLMPGPDVSQFLHLKMAPESETAQERDGLKVLVVDDNIDQVAMLSSSLQYVGYSVKSAYSGTEGLDIALHWQPDIAILDIGLPGLDGYELAQRLRSSSTTTNLRLIALSGHTRSTDITKAYEAGFDAHLSKPLEFNKLEKVIATCTQGLTHN
ncbi:MAG: ATP-binding protein, partial [Steroidobacter sp.]